jgi:SAM-dependent methyltransferase
MSDLEGYGPSTYGDRIADYYDRLFQQSFDLEGTVDLLADLASGGSALEMGIGTGRVALPLAARGIDVHGIDASPAMVAKLRDKPGGDKIPVTMGNFVDLPVAGSYALIYIPFNTLFALLTQEEQVRCFASVAAHLQPGGRFLVDASVPDLARFKRGQAWEVQRIETDAVIIEAVRHDPVQQHYVMQRILLTTEGMHMFPVNIRYAWPAELDLMARMAGLHLEHRWGGWRRQPFTAESTAHISVYQR